MHVLGRANQGAWKGAHTWGRALPAAGGQAGIDCAVSGYSRMSFSVCACARPSCK